MIPYLEKESIRHVEKGQIPEYFLIKTNTPIYDIHGRILTCDNWFINISTMEKMLKLSYKISITRIIKKNKCEIPAEMKIVLKNT